MKAEQLAYFQYKSLATDMFVNATEFQYMKEGRMTTMWVVTIIEGHDVRRLQPTSRGAAMREAEEVIAAMINTLSEIYCTEPAVIHHEEPKAAPYTITYRHQSDGSEHKITADNLDDAQLMWDSLNYLVKHFYMACQRPR